MSIARWDAKFLGSEETLGWDLEAVLRLSTCAGINKNEMVSQRFRKSEAWKKTFWWFFFVRQHFSRFLETWPKIYGNVLWCFLPEMLASFVETCPGSFYECAALFPIENWRSVGGGGGEEEQLSILSNLIFLLWNLATFRFDFACKTYIGLFRGPKVWLYVLLGFDLPAS